MKAWPVVPIVVIQVILLLAHWFVYSTWVAFWPGLTPAARWICAPRCLCLPSVLSSPRCLHSVFPTLRFDSSTGSRPSGWACSIFSSGCRFWPGSRGLGFASRTWRRIPCEPSRPHRGLLSHRGACRGLRPPQCAYHSHPPHRRATQEPAGKLARAKGSPAQRPASGADQWRPFLPPCRCHRCALSP